VRLNISGGYSQQFGITDEPCRDADWACILPRSWLRVFILLLARPWRRVVW